MQTLGFLTIFGVFYCSAQVADEIAFDLFDYQNTFSLSGWNGGSGFIGGWQFQGGCERNSFSTSVIPSSFTSFAKNVTVGNRFDGTRRPCTISRTISDTFVREVVEHRFVSVLLIRSQSGQSIHSPPGFGIAVGNLNSGESWDSDLTLRDSGSWFGVRGFLPNPNRLEYEVKINNNNVDRGTHASSTPVFFVVFEFQRELVTSLNKARVAIYDPRSVIPSQLLTTSVPFTLLGQWGISMGVTYSMSLKFVLEKRLVRFMPMSRVHSRQQQQRQQQQHPAQRRQQNRRRPQQSQPRRRRSLHGSHQRQQANCCQTQSHCHHFHLRPARLVSQQQRATRASHLTDANGANGGVMLPQISLSALLNSTASV
jgi:hypothetical protein